MLTNIFQIKDTYKGKDLSSCIYRRFCNTIRAVENSLALGQYNISKEKMYFFKTFIDSVLFTTENWVRSNTQSVSHESIGP